MSQIPELNLDEFLEHYGVPGMKWGKRKSKTTLATGYSKSQYNYDRGQMGNRYAKRVNKRVGKGDSVEDARTNEQRSRNRRHNTRLAIGAGVILFGPDIANIAVRSLNTAVLAKQASNGRKQAEKQMRDSRVGLTNYETVRMNFDPTKDIWS